MYTAYFGLGQPPFSIAPDPSYLFLSEHHREALAHLLYGVGSGGGFVLLTGEIGAGKTTVCRRFLEQIPEHVQVAYIFNPQLTVGDLMQTICHEFGVQVDSKGPGAASIKDHFDSLNANLLQCHARGEQSVLIIDEAQSLSAEVLEQLRLLTNLETSERKLLQIILIGQPELREMLARPELEQLAQRVIARFHLGALSESETRQYVAHRMGVAGWSGAPPFAPEALRRVHALTGGVPRRINLLCDRALLGAYAGSVREVDETILEHAALEVFDRNADAVEARANGRRKAFGWMELVVGMMAGGALTGGALMLWRSIPPVTSEAAAVTVAVSADDDAKDAKNDPSQSPSPSPSTAPNSSAGTSAPVEAAAAGPSTPAKEVFLGLPPTSTWMANEDVAFSALGPLWDQALGVEAPCIEARQYGLQCYRTPRMTLNGLRQMNRPAMLKLSLPGQGSGFVLATAIIGDHIELRDKEQRLWHIPMSALSGAWNGHFASLWRTPPGQKGRLNNGYQQPAATWMEQQLTRLQSEGKLPPTAKTLKEMVEAFQRTNGIEVNGIASPTTLILINGASGVDEPKLLTIKP